MAPMTPSKADFGHPYQPYSIQLQFMANLYQCIENGHVGIFESPTGTGKSLSLICGALTWLRDHKRESLNAADKAPDNGGLPTWMVEAEREQRRHALLLQRQDLEKKLEEVREEQAREERATNHSTRQTKRMRRNEDQDNLSLDTDEQYALEDYESDDDRIETNGISMGGLNAETRALLDKLKGAPQLVDEGSEVAETKILFCSRTHSQLTQFVNELRKVKPPPELPDESLAHDRGVKHVSLGARKILCINPRVSSLSSATAVNERCLELQKAGMPQESKCKFLPNRDNQDVVEKFRYRALAKLQDIEDLGKLGRSLQICPYYASRSAIGPSEIVTLPYPLLLQKTARDALGISLKDNIVIIDEAHNLMDAIAAASSVELRLSQLDVATSQVTAYVQRFKNRLKGKNRVYVTQVIRLLNSIADCLRQVMTSSKIADVAITPAQLMAGKGIDQIKPHKLVRYLQDSKLAHKVESYTDFKEMTTATSRNKATLMDLQSFLAVLMNPATEGRFFVSRHGADIAVRYTLLDPREHFRDVVEEARAVVLAGGTMSPMSDYADYLFSYLDPSKLEMNSFGHVIPVSNLFAQQVVLGPTEVEFDFTFGRRDADSMIMELGSLLETICRIAPDGVVVFFPSYDYLAQVMTVWRRPRTGRCITDKLAGYKRIFEETRGAATDVLLHDYASAIDAGTGGLMLSVVGGKLSEGINFADRLGRVVVAVGLPFPNIHGAEWKAKIEHVERMRYDQLKDECGRPDTECKSLAKAAGRDFYENACMRAVNQCIGRVIRHQNDYAAILLVDKRYASDRIEKKLPVWIKRSLQKGLAIRPWTAVEVGLQTFFSAKTQA